MRSHLSASLIYLLEQHSAKLGVPEVVSIEVHATWLPLLRSLLARPQVEAMAAHWGFVIERINNASADTFVTGRPSETLVVFDMVHDLVRPADEVGRVTTEGEALVREGFGEVFATRLDGA